MIYSFLFFPTCQQPNADQGRLILQVSISHTITHQSRQDSSGRGIGTSQRPLSDNKQHVQQRDIHVTGGIRTHNACKRAAEERRLRPLGHRNRRHILQSLQTMVSSYMRSKRGGGCGGIALPILDAGVMSAWVVSAMTQPLYRRKRQTEVGWVSGPVQMGPKHLAATGFKSQTVQPKASRYITTTFPPLFVCTLHV